MNTKTTPKTNYEICPGCGQAFKGARGLRAHQTAKFVSMSCKPMSAS